MLIIIRNVYFKKNAIHYLGYSVAIQKNPVALQPYRALADRAAAVGQRS